MKRFSKLKKAAAAVLGAAMMLTSMSILAFGAEGNSMPTIDETRNGSLTIHKYEYNGNAGNEGTGEPDDTVPEDAVPLAGVTFKITKVAELDQYYGAESNALPSVEDAKKMHPIGEPVSKMTDEKGLAVFSDLPLGLYLVQETDAPDQITGRTADFLVSIPMTNKEGNNWLYDVHVFPKNKSTYGSIELVKYGKHGNKNPEILEGAIFVLQKKENDHWNTVNKNNKNQNIGNEKGELTTDSSGRISVGDLAPGEYRFVEVGVPNNSGYIMDGASTYEFKITENGKAEINGQKGSTITVTNYKPDVNKEVKNRENGTWGDNGDYSKGDSVPYRISVDVPENVAKLKEFTLKDTLTNQKYKEGTLRIYSDEGLTTEILQNQYTLNVNESGWELIFNKQENSNVLEDFKGKTIYIYFEAELTDDAVTDESGNQNEVELEYSNKILPDSNEDGNPNTPGNPSSDKIIDHTVVYTFKITVDKQDASDSNKKLQGVEFDLYRKLADDASGNDVLVDPVKGLTGKFKKINNAPLITDDQGQVSVHGLENGEYYLVETKTNDNYNLLKAPVKIDIKVEYATEKETTTVTKDGVTTTTTVVNNKAFNNSGSNGVFTIIVKNSKGFTLPTTGGMGTILFGLGGAALAIAGVSVILSGRKKTAK